MKIDFYHKQEPMTSKERWREFGGLIRICDEYYREYWVRAHLWEGYSISPSDRFCFCLNGDVEKLYAQFLVEMRESLNWGDSWLEEHPDDVVIQRYLYHIRPLMRSFVGERFMLWFPQAGNYFWKGYREGFR